MSLLNLFKKKEPIKNAKNILYGIEKLKHKIFKDEEEKELINLELHRELSIFLFDAINSNNYEEIIKILEGNFISIKDLKDEKGYNIIEYLLFNANNELFIFLYKNYFQDIKFCFSNISVLFTIILNKKNFDLILFFLKDNLLSSDLKKENITNCFFISIQENKKELSDYITNNFSEHLDARNIEATMIYFISHGQNEKIKTIFSYSNLISKFSNNNIEKMAVFSIMNKNLDALQIMEEEPRFMKTIGELKSNHRFLLNYSKQ